LTVILAGTDEVLTHDCRTDCLTEDANYRMIFATVNDRSGDFGTGCTGPDCVLDILTHPDQYPGAHVYGTNSMPYSMISVLFPRSDDDPDLSEIATVEDLEYDCRDECFAEDLDIPPTIIAAAVNNSGEVSTVCTACLPDILRNPDMYPDTYLFGTHLLPHDILVELFPDDYVDD